MAKNGQKVDDLYLSIGLDVDQLQLDFDTAGKTVSQTMSRLNSEIKQLKIKTSIDMSKLDGAGTAVDKVRVKEQALTRELQLQTQKMNILTAAYKSVQGQYGNDSGITRKAETSLLGQQAAVEKLKASIRSLAAEETKIGVGSTGMTRIREGAQSARAGIDKLAGSYGMLSGKMMAFMAFATTGAGLFNITDSAMKAGENLYKLKTRLHTSTEEASQLGRVFQIAGTDINSVVPLFARLDKQFMSAGVEGNDLTLAMQQFGISLTDSAGNLLPISQQLDQLAKGYQKAAESGNEEAYTADVLGAKGAALIPLLQDYVNYKNIANGIKSTGLLSPEECHQLYMEWQQMQGQGMQLQMTLGAAMMPIAKDIMPEVTEGFKDIAEYIKANKDDIKAGIESWGSALKGVAETAGGLVKIVTDIGSGIRNMESMKALRNDEDVLKAAYSNKSIDTGRMYAKGVGGLFGGIGGFMLGGGPLGAAAGAYVGQEISGDVFTEFGKATTPFKTWDGASKRIELQKQEKDSLKAFQEQQQKNTDADKDNADAAKKNAEAQYIAAAKLKERKEATKALTEEIYNLTHSDLDNSLHTMQKTIDEARKKGVDEGTLAEYSSAKSAKIYQQFAENVTQPMAQAFRTDIANQMADIDQQAERYIQQGASTGAAERWAAARKSKITADWDRQVAEQIDSVWQSEYQNQLTRIENERQAWITKGLDEVKAAQWAEEQKKQIQQKSAQEMFTTQKKYLQIYRNAIAAGMGVQGAAQDIARQMRKDKGIPEDAFTSPSEIAGFEEAMKSAQDQLVPILSDSVYEGVKRALIEVQRGTNTSYEDPSGRYRIDLGSYGGSISSAAGSFHDSVERSGQAFYANVSQGAGAIMTAANSVTANMDKYKLWSEADAEHVHDLTKRWNNGERMPDFDIHKWGTYPGWSQAQAEKILKDNEQLSDPDMYDGMSRQQAILKANIDPFTALIKDKIIMPRDYADRMPRRVGVRPEPRRNMRGDYLYPATQGGDITVKVNIDRPYVNDDKALTQLADNVSKKIIDATQQGQYKY